MSTGELLSGSVGWWQGFGGRGQIRVQKEETEEMAVDEGLNRQLVVDTGELLWRGGRL